MKVNIKNLKVEGKKNIKFNTKVNENANKVESKQLLSCELLCEDVADCSKFGFDNKLCYLFSEAKTNILFKW